MNPIVHDVVLEAPIERVWEALTNPSKLALWLMPTDFEPEVGKEFSFESHPRGAWNGKIHCRLLDLHPLTRVVFSWQSNLTTEPMRVSFELQEEGYFTELTLTHSGWDDQPDEVKAQHDWFDEAWKEKLVGVLEDMVEIRT